MSTMAEVAATTAPMAVSAPAVPTEAIRVATINWRIVVGRVEVRVPVINERRTIPTAVITAPVPMSTAVPVAAPAEMAAPMASVESTRLSRARKSQGRRRHANRR